MNKNKEQIQAEWLKKADLLTETLPFMKRYANKVIVVKFGGNAMGKKEYVSSFAEDIVLLQQVGMLPIVVHGGGPQIGEMLSKLKIKTEFIDGLRVTDSETIDVVEMVLSGVTNKSIVTAISNAGAKAVGISGKDGNLITAKRLMKIDENSDSN
ncbi:MAG: acetylglutamate kinase, partial [Candidatus Puniceispirillales bacterium]